MFGFIRAVAVYFDVVGRVEVGIKMAAWGHVFLEFGMGIVFWVCGNSLKKVVDEPLRRHSARSAATGGTAKAIKGGKQRGRPGGGEEKGDEDDVLHRPARARQRQMQNSSSTCFFYPAATQQHPKRLCLHRYHDEIHSRPGNS